MDKILKESLFDTIQLLTARTSNLCSNLSKEALENKIINQHVFYQCTWHVTEMGTPHMSCNYRLKFPISSATLNM